MSHDETPSNRSGNRPFYDVLSKFTSRRQVLQGSLAAATTTFFSTTTAAGSLAQSAPWARDTLINFTPVPVAQGNGPWPVISEDYQWSVLIPWGEPIQPNGPAYNYPPNSTDQALQIGIGHDGMTFFPLRDRLSGPITRGMLAINHEFGINTTVMAKPAPESLEDVRTSQHAHGVSVVEIKQTSFGQWERIASPRARRIHVNTPVTFSGPVAGHPLLDNEAGNPFLGTVNNCSNGETPWGTYLTCEENFNGYFGANGSLESTEEQERYGFSSNGFGYGWHLFDERFDLTNEQYANEQNRFGWVVEIDPMDASQTPVKRTALGRFKHEGVAVTIGGGGRVVCYMGDDQRFDYIYKFVSSDNAKALRQQGLSPLDEGTLYVARFDDDGTGVWLELTIDNPALAARFADQAELLTYTRVAADILGATPMDRPEWTTIAGNQDVYCALTNNSQRTVPDAANPLAPNPDGHIIRWRDTDNHLGLMFTWDIFVIAETTHGTEESFSDPDGLWVDPDGRLFIQTDGGQKDGLNNQMVVADTVTGEIRRLFTGVTGDEITGVAYTPDRRTMFINTQHPGNGDPSLTNFPAPLDGVTVPRDSTFVITRKDGGIIGS